MKKYYLYIYYDVDGTPIYVGIDSTGKRWRRHWDRKSETQLSRTLRKRERELGVTLYPEFIEASRFDDAKLGEVLYIWCFGRADLGLGPLFNKTDGGDGATGVVVDERTRSRLSSSAKKALQDPEVRSRWVESLNAPHVKSKMIASHQKACTVDGITIFPSRKALIKALGQGKDGNRNENFRYL